jgi:predicted MFS family arabinose efflux permease
MTTTASRSGILALMVAHCAGMLDLVALPLWVGTLIAQYQFDPQQAGGLATLFLVGASLASVVFAPRFTRHTPRHMAMGGFAVAMAMFVLASRTASFPLLAGLHLLGGLAAGTALSFTHGTIGHAANPHRLFALVGLAFGVFGIALLGGTPGIIAHFGGQSLFLVFAAVMAAAAVLGALYFPGLARRTAADGASAAGTRLPSLGAVVWLAIGGIALMSMAQAMTLSFFERIGMARGFGNDRVTMAMAIYGVTLLFPAPLAALLEKRLPATVVISAVPLLQALFSMIVTHTTSYGQYAMAGAMMAFTILFVHTYAFGLLARLDPSGRAVAGTPAMLMVGSAIAPLLGGTLVKFIGFEAIGYAAVVLVALELALFNMTRILVTRCQEVQCSSI